MFFRMNIILILLIIPFNFVKKSKSVQYCQLNERCESHEKHLQCVKPGACQGHKNMDCEIIPNNLDSFRKDVLHHHNFERNSYAAKINSYLSVINYDEQLERITECFLKNCRRMLDTCVSTPMFTEDVAQIRYEASTSLYDDPYLDQFLIMQLENFTERAVLAFFKNRQSLEKDRLGMYKEYLYDHRSLITKLSVKYVVLSAGITNVGCSRVYHNDSYLVLSCSYAPYKPAQIQPYTECTDKKKANKVYGNLCGQLRKDISGGKPVYIGKFGLFAVFGTILVFNMILMFYYTGS